MMKVLALLGSIIFFTGYQQLHAQVINIDLESTDLAKVVSMLQQQVPGFKFVFQQESLEKVKIRQVHLKAASVKLALQQLDAQFGLSFLIDGQVISLRYVPKGVFPQSGTGGIAVGGQVTDANGTALGGVTIQVKGNRSVALSDAGGNFTIKAPDENAVLEFSYTGHERKEIKVGTARYFQVKLLQRSTALEVVTVEARRKANNEGQLLNIRKNAAIISDGISAANIEKTASITTTQALERVAGVTITDDKYVAIRGLGDRSVIAELNGARLSSSDPDRSAVPLDLVPAALLDNITIYKSMSPDRPADASAGIIELKTKSVPDSLTVQFIGQVGFNDGVGITGQFNSFSDANPGFWGKNIKQRNLSPAFLNLQNQYPGGVTQIQQLFATSRQSPPLAAEAYRINNIMLQFNPVLQTSYQKSTPNQIYGFSAGNTFDVLHGHKLGVILAGNYYTRTEDQYHSQLNQYSIYQGVLTGSPQIYSPQVIPPYISPDYVRLGKYLGYQENNGTLTINYGLLTGVTYQFNPRNEVQFQYIANRGAVIQGTNLVGAYDNTGLAYPVYSQVNQLRQSYRVFNTFNLQGEIKFLNAAWSPQLSYNLSSSTSSQDEPDFRFSDIADKHQVKFLDQNGESLGSDYYVFVIGRVHGIGPTDSIIADPNGRRYRNLNENNYNARIDLTQPFTISRQKQLLKFGINYLKRDRTFRENVLELPGTDSTGDNGLLQTVNGNLTALASYRNIGLAAPSTYSLEGQERTGGYIYQIRKSPNNYTGYYQTTAVYGMIDAHLTEALRLTGGVRLESTDIKAFVDTSKVYNAVTSSDVSLNLNPNTGYKVGLKPYYSVNLTYQYRHNMNFRLAYSTSLARPELREITNIYEFDPFQFAVVVGNPTLINQLTRSEDFRWEWFPRTNEVFAVSVFAKQIYHQLTKVFIYNSQGNFATNPEFPIVEFQNDPNMGQVYGMELEARKDLGFMGFRHLFVGANVLLAASVITKNPARLQADRINDRQSPGTSPIFEQAPYAVNAYLDYDNSRSGTNVTASFNVVGERLIQVQLDGAPDIYDRPAPTLDLVFSQKWWKRFSVKGFAKNLLNSAIRQVYADPGTGGKFYGQTYIHNQFYRGREFSLGITYNLF